jgi:hypothetical protein
MRLAKEEGILPVFLICCGYSAASVLSLEQRVGVEWNRSSVWFLFRPVLHQAANDTLDVAVSGTRRHEVVRESSNGSCASLVSLSCVCNLELLIKTSNWRLWKLHYIAITTPSLFQSNEDGSTRPDSDIWDTSDQSRFFGGHKTITTKILW